VTCEVVVGVNEYGSDVSMSISLSRKDPEVEDALVPLSDLATKHLLSHVTTSATRAVVNKAVAEKLKVRLASERAHIVANARCDLEQQVSSLQRALTVERACTRRVQDQLEKERAAMELPDREVQ